MAAGQIRQPNDRPEKSQGESLETARAANASSEFYFAGLMFILAALVPWYFEIPLNFDINDPDFNPLVFLPVVLAGIGVLSIVRTGLTTLRVRKFGSATLSPTVAVRGQLFRPVMLTKGDIDTKGDYVFVLKCLRKVRPDDDFEGRSSEKVIWKHSETVPAATRSSQGVAAMFRVPADKPPSGQEKGVNAATVRWLLSVTAPVKGVNFYAEFPIDIR